MVHGLAASCVLRDKFLQTLNCEKSEVSHNSADLGGHWKQRTELKADPIIVTHAHLRDLFPASVTSDSSDPDMLVSENGVEHLYQRTQYAVH